MIDDANAVRSVFARGAEKVLEVAYLNLKHDCTRLFGFRCSRLANLHST